MFKRILVPLDGSALAEQALPVAVQLARASDGTVSLVRVLNTEPASLPSAGGKPNLVQTISETDRTLAESYLAGIATSDVLKNIPVKTEVAAGLIAPTILSVAATHFADIIVICSHGFTGVSRWVLGSVAEKVARYSDIPVLVLREGGPVPVAQSPEKIRDVRVLVPLDGSQFAESAIGSAAELAAALSDTGRGLLHLLHIIHSTRETEASVRPGGIIDNGQANVRMATAYLDTVSTRVHDGEIAAGAADLKPEITSSAMVNNDVAHAIVQLAEQNADVIVVSTHGHGGLQRWATGSIAGRVLQTTRLPVLVVRPTNVR